MEETTIEEAILQKRRVGHMAIQEPAFAGAGPLWLGGARLTLSRRRAIVIGPQLQTDRYTETLRALQSSSVQNTSTPVSKALQLFIHHDHMIPSHKAYSVLAIFFVRHMDQSRLQ